MKIVWYGVIVVVLALIAFYTWDEVGDRKQVRVRDSQIASLETYIDSLEAAKTKVTVRYDTVTKYVTQFVTKLKVDSIIVRRDTCLDLYERVYSDTLKTEDFSLPYRIGMFGELKFIGFDKYDLFTKEVVREHIVKVPVTKEVERGHLNMYMMFGTYDFSGMNGVDLGFSYTHRKGWGMNAGWQLIEKKGVYKVGVNVRLL